MFGFPTRSRYLYHRYPGRRAYPWPPKGVIDRELAIAISQFAPGGQVVKDKAIHTAVGVAGWAPAGPRTVAEPEPARARERTSASAATASTSNRDRPTRDHCPVCGEIEPVFRVVGPRAAASASGPTSGRATSRARFEWSARSLSARVVARPGVAHWRRVAERAARRRAAGGSTSSTTTSGHDFRFAKAKCLHGYPGTASSRLTWSRTRAAPRISTCPKSEPGPRKRSPSAPRTSPTCSLDRCDAPEGSTSTPFSPSRRAAWYSLGFLLREAAARALDVQSQELRVGLRVARIGEAVRTELFLADSLENGAGYCTHLGKPSSSRGACRSPNVPRRARSSPPHSEQCDSSCYDCLRDYYNMAFHPLLDWRLAATCSTCWSGAASMSSPWAAIERRPRSVPSAADFRRRPARPRWRRTRSRPRRTLAAADRRSPARKRPPRLPHRAACARMG